MLSINDVDKKFLLPWLDYELSEVIRKRPVEYREFTL